MKEASNKKNQRVNRKKWLSMTPSTWSAQKKQVDSKREDMDESNMFKENIIKKMF